MAIGMTVDGMISGMQTSDIVKQLMQVEALGQTKLKTKMADVEKSATAYRSVNSKMEALRTAAENMTKFGAWTPAAASSTTTSVTATTGLASLPGSLTFAVVSTAATHSAVSAGTWGATTEPSGFGSSMEVFDKDGVSKGTITVGGTGSLADTVDAINKSDLGLTAAAVQVSPGQYRLQVTSKASGAAGEFSIGDGTGFNVAGQGRDAQLKVGTGPGAYDVFSPTNEFVGLMPGTTIKVTKPEAEVTVGVATDPEKVATTVKALVDAANEALTEIKKHTKTLSATNPALLAGDSTLNRLSSQILSAVSSIVGADGAPGAFGVELTRDGMVTFNKDKFTTALAADPAKVASVIGGTAPSTGADKAKGTADDVVGTGVAGRLQALTEQVTDKTTGSLTLLAQGRDKLADDLQGRIEDWDQRLEVRQKTLQRQFTAMEVALGSMQSQSSWLAGQISGLPSWS